MLCSTKPAKKPTKKIPLDERWYVSSLQSSVSVGSKAEVIITHTPSTSDACKTHVQSVESLLPAQHSGSANSQKLYDVVLLYHFVRQQSIS
jgi:hypothetical protein